MFNTTERLEEVTAGLADDEVMVAYRHCRSSFSVGRPTWIAGVQNASGDIYRMIILDGPEQADCFTMMMLKAGHTLLDKASMSPISTLDAVFCWGGPAAPAGQP